MPTHVYANSNEIASKTADGKSIAAFPDVCFTPPAPPVGPLPLPYPNTGEMKNTDKGTAKVFIKDNMAGMEGDSNISKSMGDEGATQSQGKGFITSALQGKCYFGVWSMDVKMEGKGVPRHLDMVTHNHGSMGGQNIGVDVDNVFFGNNSTPDTYSTSGQSSKKANEVIVKATIIRSTGHSFKEQGTPGTLTIIKEIIDSNGGILKTTKCDFYTLELPWKNNENKISCVKEDTYKCTISKTFSSSLSKFNLGYFYKLEDKNSRVACLFHHGNYAGDVKYKENLKLKDKDEYAKYIEKHGEKAYLSNVEGCILVGISKTDPLGKSQRTVNETKKAVEKMQNFLKVNISENESVKNATKANGIYYHDFELTIKCDATPPSLNNKPDGSPKPEIRVINSLYQQNLYALA